MYFVGSSFGEIFNTIRTCMLSAPIVNSRISQTKELMPVQIKLLNPRSRLFYNKDRTYNLAFNIAETLGYIAGINSVTYLSFFNKKISDYSDNGNDFYGSYGPRIKPYLNEVVNKLKNDKDSRQAVITIFDSDDMMVKTKDVPCTIALDFKIRDNKLNLHAMMRSNDLIWGLQYDLFAFTLIQEIVANTIGIDVGEYYHTTTSLHVYDYHWDLLKNMSPFMVQPITMDKIDLNLSETQEIANWAFKVAISDGLQPFDGVFGNTIPDILYNYSINKLKLDWFKIILPQWADKFIK